MSETTAPGPGGEPERDDETLGLTLSELLGEVWAPVGRTSSPDDATNPAALAADADSGDASTWNL